MHHAIKLHSKDNFLLWLSNRMGFLFPSKLWSNKDKFIKLYTKTKQNMIKQLNIVKLIKSTRD